MRANITVSAGYRVTILVLLVCCDGTDLDNSRESGTGNDHPEKRGSSRYENSSSSNRGIGDLATEKSEKDFIDDKARREFVQNFVPVAVPSSACDFRIHYVDWLDWNLEASFVLPAKEFDEFCSLLRSAEKMRFENGKYIIDMPNSIGEFGFNSHERSIILKCTNPPPK